MICPYCQFPAEADMVDIGVGWQQSGPYGCENCHASEMTFDDPKATPEERQNGWYRGNQ